MRFLPKKFRIYVSILSLLLASHQLAAQPGRMDELTDHVAIQIDGSWQYFAPNERESAYKLPYSRKAIEFFVGVPAYEEDSSQILFVRTAYLENQPVSLFRNTSIPWLRWRGNWISEGKITEDSYLKFHLSTENDLKIGLPENQPFFDWHDTRLWDANERSHSFISRISQLEENQRPVAAERLIRLVGNRPLMSWVRVRSNYPRRNGLFEITSSFSGTLDHNPSVQVLSFYFVNRD